MKKLIAALLLLPMLAHGAANDILMNQRNSLDTGTLSRTVNVPPGGQNGILGFNGTTVLPMFYTLGSGLSITSGVLNTVATAPTWASITGKPSFAQVATAGTYASLTGIPSAFAPSAHSQAWSTITSTPTTLAGYGITDAATQASLTSALGSYATTSALTGGLATKFNQPNGTTAQYVRGDGSLATLPVARRIETYSGTTNASGQITVTYPTAFPVAPVVQPPAPALANQVWTTVASTTTGFTLQLNQRNTVNLLSVEVLLGATVPVNGAAATFLVVAQ